MARLFVHTPYSLPECKECSLAASGLPVTHYPPPFGYPEEHCRCKYCCDYAEYDPPWYAHEESSEIWKQPQQAPHEAAESSPRYREPAYIEAAELSPRYPVRELAYVAPPRSPEVAPASLSPDARRPRHIPDAQMYSDEEASLDDGDRASCSSGEAPYFEPPQKLHPCLSQGRNCDRIDCSLAKLPREWCRECLLGVGHSYHTGKTPALHPCLRVWKHCKYGASCIFANYPRDWCLYCLRHQKHQYCDGIRPQHLPSLPNDIADRVIDHEHQKRLLKQVQEEPKIPTKTPKAPTPVRKEKRLPRRTKTDSRTMA